MCGTTSGITLPERARGAHQPPVGAKLAERNASGDIQKAREFLTNAHAAAATLAYANVERRASQALERLD